MGGGYVSTRSKDDEKRELREKGKDIRKERTEGVRLQGVCERNRASSELARES